MHSSVQYWRSMVVAAAGIAMVAMSVAPAAAADMAGWQREVVTKIANNQNYPRSAQIRKIEGVAKVELSIAASGEISKFNIIETSGFDILDAEVEKLVKKISPLPATPDGKEMTLVVPLSWRLN